MIDIRLKYIILYIATILAVGLTACSSDDIVYEGDDVFSSTLRVSASVARNTHTRAYQEKGRVENGIYYLSYPNTGNQYTVATVDFDKESTTSPGLGIVTTTSGSELKWSEIGGSPVNFYLDNVPPGLGQDDSYGPVVTFNQADNPFVAGLFDSEEGTNDLLWGDKTVARDVKSLSFDLHHNMSRVRVLVKVAHTENSVGEIDLNHAKVEITNLYPRTLSYDRITGSLALDTLGTREPVMIVDPENYDWVSVETPEDNPDTTFYMSPDIVLPPQALLENEDRSRLVITLSDGTVYSGILPHAMLIPSTVDGTMSYPVTLAFLKEHILTIRTVITEEPPELAFMPVYVVNWVDKGEFTEEAHQSGIYTASEFYRMIGYYGDNNRYQLDRYGYMTVSSDGKPIWLFNFWSSVILDYQEVFDSMHPGSFDTETGLPYDFEFSYNNYTVYVRNGDSEEDIIKVSPAELHDICIGNPSWDRLR